MLKLRTLVKLAAYLKTITNTRRLTRVAAYLESDRGRTDKVIDPHVGDVSALIRIIVAKRAVDNQKRVT